MKKPSELPINTVISAQAHGFEKRYIRNDDVRWEDLASDDGTVYVEDMDLYANDPETIIQILAIPVDIPTLIKNTALVTVKTFLDSYSKEEPFERSNLEAYYEELEQTDFTDEAVKYQ